MRIEPNASNGCAFCLEIQTGAMPEDFQSEIGYASRLIDETEKFVVIPSISPIVLDHCLLIPKRHVTSFAQLNQSELKQASLLTKNISKTHSDNNNETIFMEHGVGFEKPGGCGVEHAHLHMIPYPEDLSEQLKEVTERKINFQGAFDLESIANHVRPDQSYALVGNSKSKFTIGKSELIKSQFLRRSFAELISSNRWDWRDLDNWDNVRETLEKRIQTA